MSNHLTSKSALFTIGGFVQKGDKKGGKLGFPTANLLCNEQVPPGIYAGSVGWNGIMYPAAVYKGNTGNIIEAHLLDFSHDLYGEKITIYVYNKIRDPKIFSGEEDLIAAISKDIADIKVCLRE